MVEQLHFGLSNCFLIMGNQQSILVDTGTISIREQLYHRLQNEKISLIILTHGHIDHIANASFLSKQLHAPIAIRIEDEVLVRNNLLRPLYADSIWGGIMKFFSIVAMKRAKVTPFTSEITLEDGMSLEEFGVSGKIIFLGGHTQGSLGVLTREGELIVGDAMMNLGRPAPACIYEDKVLMLESIEKIKQCSARRVYVGHGAAFTIRTPRKNGGVL